MDSGRTLLPKEEDASVCTMGNMKPRELSMRLEEVINTVSSHCKFMYEIAKGSLSNVSLKRGIF